jgi:hypothetical protein
MLEHIVADNPVKALISERKLLADPYGEMDSVVSAELFNGSASNTCPKFRNVQPDNRSRIPVTLVIGRSPAAPGTYV